MPNHCTNELRVSGPRESLERFKAQAADPALPIFKPSRFEIIRGSSEVRQLAYMQDAQILLNDAPMNFHAFVPVPPEIQAQTWDPAGYEWQCDNWGTKWNAYDQSFEDEGESLFYRFDTAWSPPVPVITAMAQQYPELAFEDNWFEEGGGAGWFCFRNGEYEEEEREHPSAGRYDDYDEEEELSSNADGSHA